ncbi:MAG: HAD family hydrolase [Alloprevotella sp.]
MLTPNNRKISAVVFDLDGTLLDTIADLASAVNYALAAHGRPVRTNREIRSFLGNGIRRLVAEAVPEGTAESDYEAIFATFRTRYVAHCVEQTVPYEGIMTLLERLQTRGIKMAIVSNKLQPAVTQLHETFFGGLIDVAVGERPGIPRKPDPTSLLTAIEGLGETPETTLYVGDSEVDIETARAAGCRCATVLWGFRDEAFLRSRYPEAHYIRRPEELEHYILN